ncbi:MAG: class I SAM-dependent methyltransferase [Chlorobi bacterium]|nr:class I SAM-dependent methyltransferase [Chlorobiota bacterium]MCI0715868.1 class I SAM-dependent methyltransferase [Chlorobiota bacterium]
MKKWKPNRTEFYETAVAMGFYGRDDGGLSGKKDNVRKFWEDVFVKLLCRNFMENQAPGDRKLRILDLGCGSGEGFELLTHIPSSPYAKGNPRDFVLKPGDIESYTGIDISPSMISQGRANYKDLGNVKFEYGNLEDGLPQAVLRDTPFDIYFSTYGSLSHLHPEALQLLLEQLFKHSANGSVLLFDTHGKYSPSWPKYWAETKTMLPYTMAYLVPGDKRKEENVEWFNLCYWDVEELKALLTKSAKNAGVELNLLYMLDRSIYVGRHMDTGLLSGKAMPLRYQVNRLLDHGYRGEVEHLRVDLSHLETYKKGIDKKIWERLVDYQRKWNKLIYLLEALMNSEDAKVKNFIENTDIELMSDDLKFITWLYRNNDRFPVVDFWASIIGPQIAVILRNMEMSYPEGVGCGHGLLCAIEIIK